MGRGSGQGGDSGGVSLRAGVHVQRITGNMGPLQAPKLDRQTARLLQAHPLGSVVYRPGFISGEGYGSYNWKGAQLQISKELLNRSGGSGILAGQHSTTTAAKSTAGAIRNTLTHEVGHHLHMTKVRTALTDPVESWYNKRTKSGNFITNYAGSDKWEFFAESFTAYKRFPKQLRARDPELYNNIKTYLRNYEK